MDGTNEDCQRDIPWADYKVEHRMDAIAKIDIGAATGFEEHLGSRRPAIACPVAGEIFVSPIGLRLGDQARAKPLRRAHDKLLAQEKAGSFYWIGAAIGRKRQLGAANGWRGHRLSPPGR